jgi:DNA-directed RNA polymerase subunit H (RpoH/RPB5)
MASAPPWVALVGGSRRWENLCTMLLHRGLRLPPGAGSWGVERLRREMVGERALLCEGGAGETLALFLPPAESLDKKSLNRARSALAALGREGARALVITLRAPSAHVSGLLGAESSELAHLPWAYFARSLVAHPLVPRHEVFPGDWRAFGAAFGLDVRGGSAESTLPHLLRTDPVARYYAWPPGTIVLVHRPPRGPVPAELAARVVVHPHAQ